MYNLDKIKCFSWSRPNTNFKTSTQILNLKEGITKCLNKYTIKLIIHVSTIFY